MPDLSAKTEAELEALIANHRPRGAIVAPLYVGALEELGRRKGHGFAFEKTRDVILRAARNGRVLTYKDLADESGLVWSKVHWSVGPHLERMLEFCDRNGWPLLCAIVVPKEQADAGGKLRGSSLEGFIKGCERVGIPVDSNHEAFADAEQERVFEWAKQRGGE